MKKELKIIIGVLILALFILPTSLLPRIIKVKKVECISQFGPCSAPLSGKIGRFSGASFLEAKRVIADVLDKEVLVKDYSLQFKLPNTIVVNVLERKAKFGLKSNTQNLVAEVDDEAYIVSIEKISNLPQVLLSESLGSVGAKVSDKQFFALKILSDLFSLYQVKEGVIANETFIATVDGIKVVFPLVGDREVLLSSLSLVIKKYEAEGEAVKVIDLRFKNPVIHGP